MACSFYSRYLLNSVRKFIIFVALQMNASLYIFHLAFAVLYYPIVLASSSLSLYSLGKTPLFYYWCFVLQYIYAGILMKILIVFFYNRLCCFHFILFYVIKLTNDSIAFISDSRPTKPYYSPYLKTNIWNRMSNIRHWWQNPLCF